MGLVPSRGKRWVLKGEVIDLNDEKQPDISHVHMHTVFDVKWN